MFESFFTDRCGAYVDDDGWHLEGAALELARQNPHAKRCGERVPWRSKFCRKCGSHAPASLRHCVCGKWIGADAAACPHCGHRINRNGFEKLHEGIWQKDGDVFAERIELADLHDALRDGLKVQEHQCALFLDGGRCTAVLKPGNHAMSELMEDAAGPSAYANKSLLFVDGGEMAFPVVVRGAVSKDSMSVDCRLNVLMRFEPERHDAFLKNVLGNDSLLNPRRTGVVCYSAIAESAVLASAEGVVGRVCGEHTIDELFKSPGLRDELETRLREAVSASLERHGMMFCGLDSVDFEGDDYRQLQLMHSELETRRREMEFQFAAGKLRDEQEKRMECLKSDLDEYLKQLSHDAEVNASRRRREKAAEQSMEEAQRRELAEQRKDEAFRQEEQETALKLKHAEMEQGFRMRLAELEADEIRKLNDLARDKAVQDELRNREIDRRRAELARERKMAELEEAFQIARREELNREELDRLSRQHEEAMRTLEQDGRLARERQEWNAAFKRRLEEQEAALTEERAKIDIEEYRRRKEVRYESLKAILDMLKEKAMTAIQNRQNILVQLRNCNDAVLRHQLLKAYGMMSMQERMALVNAAYEKNTEVLAEGDRELLLKLAEINEKDGWNLDVNKEERT